MEETCHRSADGRKPVSQRAIRTFSRSRNAANRRPERRTPGGAGVIRIGHQASSGVAAPPPNLTTPDSRNETLVGVPSDQETRLGR